ncbi:MAG: translation initiation factor IF-2 [Cryomorphaceae bacterium]|nr:translation initiation factor IF-2 [Cryomorphaceae bacterium]
MSKAPQRLSKVIRELNISLNRAVEFLTAKGVEVDANPNVKINEDVYDLLVDEFEQDKTKKEKSEQVSQQQKEEKEIFKSKDDKSVVKAKSNQLSGPKTVGKIDLDNLGKKQVEAKKEEEKPAPVVEKPVVEEKSEPVAKPVVETIKEAEKPASEDPKPKVEKEKPAEEVKAKQTEQKVEEPKKPVEEKPEPKTEKPKVEELKAEKVEKAEQSEKTETVKEKAPETKAPENPEAKKEEPAKEKPVAEKPVEEKPKEEKPVAEKPTEETPKVESPAEGKPIDPNNIATKYQKLSGPNFTGQKIDLEQFKKKKKKVASSSGQPDKKAEAKKPGTPATSDDKKKRRRIHKDVKPGAGGAGKRPPAKGGRRTPTATPELTEEQIQKQIKETLEKLTGGKKSKGSKFRRAKKEERREQEAHDQMQQDLQGSVIKLTEFVTVGELATMMDKPVTDIIMTCMQLGLMVTMNQRLDAETLSIVAEEYGFNVEFVSAEVTDMIEDVAEEDEKDLIARPPIVTVMGHVDHGKTSLLDHIRSANVIAGESGGITQHIGAYTVELDGGQHITFLDTPGHEAFTAMRARGAQVTDIAIIVVAADDDVMPQTKEAISHAQAAGVPIIFAINKIDKPGANPEKVKESLANMNLLVEDWGGKIQSQEISALKGINISELLDKVLLEAELLELKANPNRNANGTVVEATLDKGRGYVTTLLVQRGTLKVGDVLLAGQYSGRVRAMMDERGKPIKEAGPSTPVSILGLDGAPMAGDKFNVMDDEKEARGIAARRQQLQREQSTRTQKNITLEEIGRRLALGDFKELNIILKCDVDGSVEALSDSLQRLSTAEIAVNIVHKAVGQITESDVLLATASNAIVIGFNVRPSANARKIAEKESVDIRNYAIIYDAINEVKDAMEGMLSPEVKEKITCNVEVRETFKISKVGTIAGCMVLDGTIKRSSRVRIIRDGVVVYTGELGSLKRFKDDVKEVQKGYECGLNIQNFNDIKVGDIVEGFEEVEVKKTL